MERKAMTAVYSIAHFFVDMCCAFLMMRFVRGGESECFLFYNFCAFALQMPIGIILDKCGGGHRAAAAGCGLVFLSYFAAIGGLLSPAAICAGVGNALFHAGGGVYVLDKFSNSGALGVFVSPGAIGLYLGTVRGKGDGVSYIFPMLIMLFAAAFIFASPYIFRCDDKKGAAAENFFSFKMSAPLCTAAVLFFAVVVIRSLGGFALSFPWKITPAAAFAAVLVTAGGKALGGFASDFFGKERAAAASMLGAALLYLFSDNIICGLMAILLFNMSMPMTLRAAADIFRGGRGFSFGLLTFALFLGYVPVYTSKSGMQIGRETMTMLCMISAAMLLAGFALQRRTERSDDPCNN
ncbi:MAG: hypothetical protein ACI4J0_00435 [Huintestinicola sp.]|uniref:hypothetical protein n=1 Tax=Huintestinicola sp. TaxID=2981661 RepID=UPI003F057B45